MGFLFVLCLPVVICIYQRPHPVANMRGNQHYSNLVVPYIKFASCDIALKWCLCVTSTGKQLQSGRYNEFLFYRWYYAWLSSIGAFNKKFKFKSKEGFETVYCNAGYFIRINATEMKCLYYHVLRYQFSNKFLLCIDPVVVCFPMLARLVIFSMTNKCFHKLLGFQNSLYWKWYSSKWHWYIFSKPAVWTSTKSEYG